MFYSKEKHILYSHGNSENEQILSKLGSKTHYFTLNFMLFSDLEPRKVTNYWVQFLEIISYHVSNLKDGKFLVQYV